MAKMARILKDGRKMDYVSTGDFSNGDIVEVGSTVGLIHDNVVAGDICAMDYSGTIEIMGVTADALNQGELCYFDGTDKATSDSVSGEILGLVVTGKASGVDGVVSVDMGVKAV